MYLKEGHDFFSIQVGACKDSSLLKIWKAEAEKTGLSIQIITGGTDSEGRSIRCLQLGQFKKFGQAKQELARVKRAFPKAYIVP